MTQPAPLSARIRLLNAALTIVRRNGYAATTVDDLCRAAGVTKGAFFHHFRTKDELAVAAAGHWAAMTGALFAAAPYHAPADPLDRILAYLDFRVALLAGQVPEFTCFVGTILQETYDSAPAIGAAAYASITGHARTLEPDFAEAIALYGPPVRPADFPTAASLALHTQVVLQGAFILAKGTGTAAVAQDSLGHLRRYLTLLLHPKEERP